LVEDIQPILKKFRTGDAFRLAVFNFGTSEDIPFVGFSVERIMNEEDLYIEGSNQVLDPAKNTLTKPTIAIVSH
jgi:hypothetical protein